MLKPDHLKHNFNNISEFELKHLLSDVIFGISWKAEPITDKLGNPVIKS